MTNNLMSMVLGAALGLSALMPMPVDSSSSSPGVLRVRAVFAGCESTTPKRLRLVYGGEPGGDVVNTSVAQENGYFAIVLHEGRYELSMSDGKCAFKFDAAILAGHIRDMSALFTKLRNDGDVEEEDIYQLEGSAIVVPWLLGRSVYLQGPDTTLRPTISNDVAYFDYVTKGSYNLIVCGQNWQTKRPLQVSGDRKLHVYDLSLRR